jgi:hypothetical protein
MTQPTPGAQLSEDGNYWWDGSQWQPVAQSGGADPSSSQQPQGGSTDAQGRQLSEDGNYYWDGSAWQPVDGAGSGAGGGSAQEQFSQAMAQYGYNIDANAVPDLSTLQSAIDTMVQWYQSLDSATAQGIDAATVDPGEAAVALGQAGLVSGADALLQAFDQIQGSLGDLLQASQYALQVAQQGAAQATN